MVTHSSRRVVPAPPAHPRKDPPAPRCPSRQTRDDFVRWTGRDEFDLGALGASGEPRHGSDERPWLSIAVGARVHRSTRESRSSARDVFDSRLF